MFEKFEPSPAAIDRARRLFEEGEIWPAVAAALGASVSTARKYAKIWGWVRRETQPSGAARKKQQAAESDPSKRPSVNVPDENTPSLAHRVETAVRKELSAVERRLGSSTAGAAERNARVLASLVKSLAELRKLEREDDQDKTKRNEGDNDDGPRPPRDLDKLRAELAADLQRLHDREVAARNAGES